MAKSAPTPSLNYRLLTWALFPIACAHTLYIAVKYKNLTYIFNRIGLFKKPSQINQPIWCHCASVGEINTALPLLQTLDKQGESLVITTNTVTGYETLAQANLNNTCYAFLPLDYSSFAQRLINCFTPKLCLVFETELWPNLLLTTVQNKITLAIMNGRISEKTLNAPAFLLKNYKKILTHTHSIISSSNENTMRFTALGANIDSITTLDNLKFAQLKLATTGMLSNPLNYTYLLCVSTHEGEEQKILTAWKQHAPNKLGLVIAPRHPQRTNEICQLLKQFNLTYHLHSNKNSDVSIDTIYVIDTLGELMPFIAHAHIVFMGGSLVPVGGHNVIEPAQFKRCILIGQHHDDFKNIVNDLKTRKGIQVIDNAEQLVKLTLSLLDDNEKRIQTGEQAYHYIESKKQVLNAYTDIVQELLRTHTA